MEYKSKTATAENKEDSYKVARQNALRSVAPTVTQERTQKKLLSELEICDFWFVMTSA